ncbi:MAG: O-antigen ligase family protein [Alphaproteobacteria bacterium]
MHTIRSLKEHWGGGTAVVVLFAITLQVLTTVEVADVNLRVSASDLLLPFAAAWVLWNARKGVPIVPEWRVRHLWIWLAVLTVWMAVALLNGRLQTGEWVRWGVVNKGLGWLVLLAYFVLGAWISSTFGAPARERFLKAFLLVGWAVCILSLFAYALYLHQVDISRIYAPYDRTRGLFDNPNAFGFAVATFLVLQAPFLRRRPLFPAPLMFAGMGVALTALVFSGSRSAWLGLLVGWLALVFLRALRPSDIVKGAAAALLLGGLLLFGPSQAQALAARIAAFGYEEPSKTGEGEQIESAADKSEQIERTLKRLYITRKNQFTKKGVSTRIAVHREALEAWRSSPVLGLGLGTFYRMREQKGEGGVTTVHTTVLWLLTETGLVGAALFVGFFVLCARALLRREGRREDDPFVLGAFGLLMVLAGASLGTELMYQRHLWFISGLALAIPATAPAPREAARAG